ncbi:MAG: DUF948 domain-containing protein [Actinomycetota bacterium]|nr:DUF948 domain-containing protein [Actinomycetota bacterium]
MSAGEIAGLVAAFAFVLLVGFTAVPLLKLGKVLDQTRFAIRDVAHETLPLIDEVTTTVSTTNQQLAKVDAITTTVQEATTNVSALTAAFAATLGGPVVKVAAFTYGVRRALGDRRLRAVERHGRRHLRGRTGSGSTVATRRDVA